MTKRNRAQDRQEDEGDVPSGGRPQGPVEFLSYVVESRERTLNLLCIGAPVAIIVGFVFCGLAIAVSGMLAWLFGAMGSACFMSCVSLIAAIVVRRTGARGGEISGGELGKAVGNADDDGGNAGDDCPSEDSGDSCRCQTGDHPCPGGDRA